MCGQGHTLFVDGLGPQCLDVTFRNYLTVWIQMTDGMHADEAFHAMLT